MVLYLRPHIQEANSMQNSKSILSFLFLNVFVFIFSLTATAQDRQEFKETEDTSWKSIYRSVPAKENELIHTKLVASFNYEKAQLNGEVWLNLRAHNQATNALNLDAKAMDIHAVDIVQKNKHSALHYTYDGLILKIQLNKKYTPSEIYTDRKSTRLNSSH